MRTTSALLLALVLAAPASAGRFDTDADLRDMRRQQEEEQRQLKAERDDIALKRRYEAEQRRKEIAEQQTCALWTFKDGKGVIRFFPMSLQIILNAQNPKIEVIEDEGEVVAFKIPRSYGAFSLYDVNGEFVLHEQGQNGSAVPDYTLENVYFALWTPASAAARTYQAAVRTGEAAGLTSNVARVGFMANYRQFLISLGKRAHEIAFKLDAARKSRAIQFAEGILQKKGWASTRHAEAFGVLGNYSKANEKLFEAALRSHVSSGESIVIAGSYRGEKVVHFLNPRTGLNVMTKPTGEFMSGWQLSRAKLTHLLASGKI